MSLAANFLYQCSLRDQAFAVHLDKKMSKKQKADALAKLQELYESTTPRAA